MGYMVHHDSFHRVICMRANKSFSVGQVYDAISKESHYSVKDGTGRIITVSLSDFNSEFKSIITHFHVPNGTKGIIKTNVEGAQRLRFDV